MADIDKFLKTDACKLLIKHFPVGTYEIDYKTVKITNPNNMILEYTGYTKEEFENLSPFELLTENSKKYFMERLQKIASGEDVSDEVEFEIITKYKKIIWVLLTPSFNYDEKGNVTGAFCIVTNITKQKQTEFALKKAKDQAQMYLELAFDMFLVLDVNGNIKLINKAGCDMLGIDECFLLGRNWFEDFIPEEERESLFNYFQEILHTDCNNGFFENENYIKKSDGSTILVRWRNKLFCDEHGNIEGIFCSGDNITTQRELESKMLQMWDKAEQTIEEFLSKKIVRTKTAKKKALDKSLDNAVNTVVNGGGKITW